MKKLKSGFYTALGTPLDEDGNIIEESLRREIEMQIEAGASGLLLLGSMGIEESVKLDAWGEAARIAADAVNGRVALFVGAMDNSVWRVKERLALLRGLNISGVVMTTPFYSLATDAELERYFSAISDSTEHPLFLYDLPGVTKIKISFPLVKRLIDSGKIKGIKTGDIVLARQLYFAYPDFEVLYSNIDAFDVAMSFGIDKVLDGMFSCTPKNARKFIDAYNSRDIKTASLYLNNIIKFRDCLFGYPGSALLYIYTVSMNLLGMDGIFCPDYKYAPVPHISEKVAKDMHSIGEL